MYRFNKKNIIYIILETLCFYNVFVNAHSIENCPKTIYGLDIKTEVKCSRNTNNLYHPFLQRLSNNKMCYPIKIWFSIPSNIQLYPRCLYIHFSLLSEAAVSLNYNKAEHEDSIQIFYELETLFGNDTFFNTITRREKHKVILFLKKLKFIPRQVDQIAERLKYLIDNTEFMYGMVRKAQTFFKIKDINTKTIRTFFYNLQLVYFNANHLKKLTQLEKIMKKVIPRQRELVLHYGMKMYGINTNYLLHYCDSVSNDNCLHALTGVDFKRLEDGYIMKIRRKEDNIGHEISFYNRNDVNENEICDSDECYKESVLNMIHTTKRCFSGYQYITGNKRIDDITNDEINELIDKSSTERSQKCLESCLLIENCDNKCLYTYTNKLMDYIATITNDIISTNDLENEEKYWNNNNNTNIKTCIDKRNLNTNTPTIATTKASATESSSTNNKPFQISIPLEQQQKQQQPQQHEIRVAVNPNYNVNFENQDAIKTCDYNKNNNTHQLVLNINITYVKYNYNIDHENNNVNGCKIENFCNKYTTSPFANSGNMELNNSKQNKMTPMTIPISNLENIGVPKFDNYSSEEIFSNEDNSNAVNNYGGEDNIKNFVLTSFESTIQNPQIARLKISPEDIGHLSAIEKLNIIQNNITIVLCSKNDINNRLVNVEKKNVILSDRCKMPWSPINTFNSKIIQICKTHYQGHPSFEYVALPIRMNMTKLCRYEVMHLLTKNSIRIGLYKSDLFYRTVDNVQISTMLEFSLIILSNYADLQFELIDAEIANQNDIELNVVIALNHFHDPHVNGFFHNTGVMLIDPLNKTVSQVHRVFMHELMHMLGFNHYDDSPSILASRGLNQKLLIYPMDIINLQLYYGGSNEVTDGQYFPINNLISIDDITKEFGQSSTDKTTGLKRSKRHFPDVKSLRQNQLGNLTKNTAINILMQQFKNIKFPSQKIYSPKLRITN